MKFPKIEVGYNIVFNNTGFEWTDIQSAICEIVEKKYNVLHCITKNYNEKNNVGAVKHEIKGIQCLLYFKVNTESLVIDVVAIKEDNRNSKYSESGIAKEIIDKYDNLIAEYNEAGKSGLATDMAGFEDLTYDLREEYGLLED